MRKKGKNNTMVSRLVSKVKHSRALVVAGVALSADQVSQMTVRRVSGLSCLRSAGYMLPKDFVFRRLRK